MAKIFISYRRVDTPYVASVLCERLQQRFGNEAIFYDEDTIPLGIDFRTFLDESVSQCEVLLALIGDRWEAEPLHNPKDFVRIELEAALKREIPVIPVLIRGAEVPTEASLPDSLKDFSYRNGTRLRSGSDLFYDLERLIQGIERVTNLRIRQKISTQSSPIPKHTAFLQELGIEMVRVEGGHFKLGGNIPCTLSDFYLARTELTNAQYLAFVHATQTHFPEWMEEGNPYNLETGSNRYYQGFTNSNQPVVGISWNDAVAYCKWLSEQTGKSYRLPTEAEWEYAARGGKKSRGFKYAGADVLEEVGWYEENSASKTHPVGQKKANELGLYDMCGNIWEWCQDWYGDYPTGTLKDPKGPESGQRRVLRGGSWLNYASDCRVSNRDITDPARRYSSIGFRLAGDGS
ncbi:MAG: SUMF1/EgtB/PvdO family nonheme iron enzyme [Bacteroidota bacterium]